MKWKAIFGFSKLYRRRNKIPVDELEIGKCQNCGYEFRGHFCPDCGQEVAEFNRPLGFIVYDFMGNFFAFDTRFFKTFKYLLFYPGFLTKEFFKGKRTSYSPPFRIFVFLSFVLFLLLSFLTDKGLKTELDLNMPDSLKISENIIPLTNEQRLQIETYTGTSLKDSTAKMEIDNLNIDLGGIFFGKGSIRTRLNRLADALEISRAQVTDPQEKQQIQEYIAMCRAPEIVISTLLKYLSWASFLLLPIFALILKLFYVRRKQLYIRHLIFSIHLHSFLFMILIPVTLLRLIFSSVPEFLNLILIGSFPIYFLIALHNFYGQNWIKTFFKFIGMSVIYNFTLLTVVLFTFLKSIHIF